MDHYVDIRVLPDPEFKETTLLNALFSKFHRELVRHKETAIGVSFPHANATLGPTLRLHGTQPTLSGFMSNKWLKGLGDYTERSPLQQVPDNCQYRRIRRVQVKSSAERLLRRSLTKGWITEAEVKSRLMDGDDKRCRLPFLQLTSKSTGQTFKLFVEQGKPGELFQPGSFNSYGLSNTATLPTF